MTQAPAKPTPTAPRPYHFPAFERTRFDNGMSVWLVPLPDRDEPDPGRLVLESEFNVRATIYRGRVVYGDLQVH